MENTTTPLKGAFITLVTGVLMTHLGFDPLNAGTVATAAWILASAAIAYAVPANLKEALADKLGVRL